MSAVLTEHCCTSADYPKLAEPKATDTVVIARTNLPHDMGYKSLNNDGPVGMALQWLQSALECKDFQWDGDQRECAEQSLKDAREWMRLCGPVPPEPEQVCQTCGNMGAVGTADRAEPCPTCSKGTL